MTKNWIFLICHRAGEKSTRQEAEQEHRNLLLSDAQNNKQMARIHPGFAGPQTTCSGNIKLRSCLTPPRKEVPQAGVLGGDEPWL